jgi:hypothetical protein
MGGLVTGAVLFRVKTAELTQEYTSNAITRAVMTWRNPDELGFCLGVRTR